MTRRELYKLADAHRTENNQNCLVAFQTDSNTMLTEESLKEMHKLLGGTGVYRTGDLQSKPIGIMPPEAGELPRLMGHFISQLQISRQMFHPIEYATICHKRILELYPFKDKNEEVAFLVLNVLLMQGGYQSITIEETQRVQYISKLQKAQHPSHPDIDGFITFITECEVKAQGYNMDKC